MLSTALALGGTFCAATALARPSINPIPHMVTKNGRHALVVDGAPFLMLGAQVNNSSNYASQLPKVWPMLDRLHANTVEVPIAWQQVEPIEGRFDFSFLQTLLDQARAHDKRVVLLWFGTWKNTAPGYTPDWFKLDDRRFPRMKTRDGKTHGVHSPMFSATMEADKRAFVAMMTYLKAHDTQNTVILVQPENETGSYGSPRDFGVEANRLFNMAVPPELTRALRKPAGTWAKVFGAQADRAFNTWHTARFVGQVAAAGKAVKPLPMYVNASLADPTKVPAAGDVASGGPQQDVLDIWKVAAPAIDFAAPDIYDRDESHVVLYLDGFERPDNALMVPEIGNAAEYARFLYAAFGRCAIGFSPFGMDDTGYLNYPLGAKLLDAQTIDAFADKYALFAAMGRDWPRIAFERPTWGTARPADGSSRSKVMGEWSVTASYGEWQMGLKEWTWIKTEAPPWATQPVGGAVVAQLSPDEFLVAGDHVRMTFAPRTGAAAGGIVLRVEEGRFQNGEWLMDRVWNGDQTDYGLNFTDSPVWLKVTMGRYR